MGADIDWSGDRWAELLEATIRDATGPSATVELRRINPHLVLIWADPGNSAGAPLEISVSPEQCQVFVADVLNAEFRRPHDEQEVDAIVRGVIQHGCRVVKSGFRRYVEIGRQARVDEQPRAPKVERDWTAWSVEARPADQELRLVYSI